MSRQELAVESLAGVGFVAAAAALFLASPPSSLDPLTLAVAIAATSLAMLARFETPFGFTPATQLAFVPLLFVLPLGVVPITVLAAVVLATVPRVRSGSLRPARLLLCVANAWFAIGAVVVFVLAGRSPATAPVSLLLLALVSQFAFDFIVSAIRLRVGRGVSLGEQLRDSAWVYGIDAALSPVAVAVASDLHPGILALLVPVPLVGLLAMFGNERHQRLESLLELKNAYRGTALVLGEVVEADDGYTGAHSNGVVALAVAVGEAMHLDADRARNLEFAALLHDVGKIAIPKEIINKPGKLDPSEWNVIRTHTLEGQRMLDRVGGFMHRVGLIVRSHHERWDGQGYPDGLVGQAIPLESRIITCCDSWNAMRTDRPYRKALSHSVALSEMTSNAGRQFDPRVVSELLRVVGQEHERAPDETVAASEDPAPGAASETVAGVVVPTRAPRSTAPPVASLPTPASEAGSAVAVS